MMNRTLLLASAALLSAPALAATTQPQANSAAISGLGIRNIGSATMSGRIAAVDGRQDSDGKVTLFVGSASGGVWKSDDGGTTFKPVFDKEDVQSIGAVALDPTNKDVVWIGTGETWTRNSVSIGDGVYKSTDGGETWTRMGLNGTERIDRIIVDPKDGNTVYVCAPGPLWSDSSNRGLYKTSDGGQTWSLVLVGLNQSTGCSSVAMDPSNPNHLLAGTWDFRRKAYEYRSGGPSPESPSGSRFAESFDGGRTWTYLNADNRTGLPKQPWGRLEIAYAPSDPNRVYAFIENVRSALYVSNDGGKSWEERDRSQGMVWRPFYFARIVVDPKDEDRLFKMGYSVIASEDAGKSFANAAGGSHGDWHDVWINPTNTKHMVGADDGGLWYSYDGGNRWWKANNLPVSQFYHVSVDDKDPYQVYGGLQDNSDWVGDSEYPGGITNSRWENLYGGDGFWTWADPADPDNYVYTEAQGGYIGRVNRHTHEIKDIKPRGGYKEKLRYNWNTPIALSPNEKGTIYIGSQFLFRSRDHGATWDRISPDLTTNDPVRQRQEESGGITVDNSAAEMNTTIYSISESPKAAGQIWIGTDDGNVQLTRDGGQHWTDLTKNLRMPKGNWISWVEASRYDPAVAYVTNDRHASGDMNPYLYRTTDYGRTWTQLIGPKTANVRGYAHVVKEDPVDPNLLYVGTEFGLFASLDGGRNWAQFKPDNFPAVAVRDLAFGRGDDLVLATHGRGIWIIDDVSPLRKLTPQTLASTVALIPGAPVQQRIEAFGGWSEGDASYSGENPPGGAVVTYYQKARHVIGRMKMEVLDSSGKVVDEIPVSRRVGLNRVSWTMRTKPPVVPPAASIAGASTQGQRFLPGTYTVRLTKAGEVTSEPLTVTLDRRAKFSVADRQAQFAAAERVKGLFARMSKLVGEINSVREGASKVGESDSAPPAIKAAAQKLGARADELRKELVATKEGGAITGEERLREHVDDVYGGITSNEGRPPAYLLQRIDSLDRELKDVEASFEAFKARNLASFNASLQQANLPPITVAEIELGPDDLPDGGRLSALANGLVGLRFYGDISRLEEQGERD
jgi:photosystem II stability/assembly factor-like uncharacterized protein